MVPTPTIAVIAGLILSTTSTVEHHHHLPLAVAFVTSREFHHCTAIVAVLRTRFGPIIIARGVEEEVRSRLPSVVVVTHDGASNWVIG